MMLSDAFLAAYSAYGEVPAEIAQPRRLKFGKRRGERSMPETTRAVWIEALDADRLPQPGAAPGTAGAKTAASYAWRDALSAPPAGGPAGQRGLRHHEPANTAAARAAVRSSWHRREADYTPGDVHGSRQPHRRQAEPAQVHSADPVRRRSRRRMIIAKVTPALRAARGGRCWSEADSDAAHLRFAMVVPGQAPGEQAAW